MTGYEIYHTNSIDHYTIKPRFCQLTDSVIPHANPTENTD